MKRAALIFALIFLLTALIPLGAYFKDKEQSQNEQTLTPFSTVQNANDYEIL